MYKEKKQKMQTTAGVTVNVSGQEISALMILITVLYGKLLLVFTMYW